MNHRAWDHPSDTGTVDMSRDHKLDRIRDRSHRLLCVPEIKIILCKLNAE